jgi:hypothetical protein
MVVVYMLKCKHLFLQNKNSSGRSKRPGASRPLPRVPYLIFLTHGKRSKVFSSLNEAATVQSLKIFGLQKSCFK